MTVINALAYYRMEMIMTVKELYYLPKESFFIEKNEGIMTFSHEGNAKYLRCGNFCWFGFIPGFRTCFTQ
jgi:hypothetical protein